MRPVIVVFAKAPRPGFVKTRFTPEFTPHQAAELHGAFVRDTLANLLVFDHVDLELHTDMETDAWREFEVPRRLQHEGDLGLKMFHALRAALARGVEQAMILGSDAPDLPLDYVTKLFACQADIALGPAKDGGYYAIAARRVDEKMFDGVAWSTSEALKQTASACARCGLSVEIGPIWYDLDTPADLARLTGNERAKESSRTLALMSAGQISLE